ncbi:glycosyltransferase family 2 protein [Pediococcus acidilactici]|nr:glycosyltransferase family A protein [Pediococcus acidilactici]MCF4061660.1 glycosyltransferase family 2 protein [Pediococcus acidilactici]
MKENITIIIPIYNLEDYLDNCLNSIKKQTYTNFEVLLIDDGSTDKSKQICKFYVKEDSRFKYFYQHCSYPSI